MKKNIVVYTAITHNYNPLRNPQFIDPVIDYICFTDDAKWLNFINKTIWQIKAFPKETKGLDQVRMARFIKLHPHLFFQKYEYSIWVDGSINIIGDVRTLIAKYNDPAMLCFKHPLRSCIYEEGQICIDHGKDDPQLILRQLEFYKQQGYPMNGKLIESGVLIRRHTDSIIIKLMEDWWHELKTQSSRDQLSFPYVAWRNSFWPTIMNDDHIWGSSEIFANWKKGYHGGKKLSLRDKLRILTDIYFMWRLKR